MAIKAVELSFIGIDVWHSVNTVSVEPTNGKRGDETVVSYQTAIVTDIDITGAAHKSNNLAVNFEEAKSFLPIKPSILLDSGHGAQAYYIFNKPILVTEQNREELKRRNNLWLDVIRLRAPLTTNWAKTMRRYVTSSKILGCVLLPTKSTKN